MTDREAMLVIPHNRLSPEALSGLIEEFRDPWTALIRDTRGAPWRKTWPGSAASWMLGEAVIVYDARTQTGNIVAAETLK